MWRVSCTEKALVNLRAAGQEIEKQLPGGKVKTKAKAEIIIQTAVRNKTKNTTSVSGLELFGIKLSEASKLFGKKFACGASVTKNPLGTEQIEMQVGPMPEHRRTAAGGKACKPACMA